jgi:hypothetical protein
MRYTPRSGSEVAAPERLDPLHFEAICAEGQAMVLEWAIACALDESIE